MLTVSSLRKVFKGRGWKAPLVTALDDISFEIGKGESLGIVGESGSGKSTLGRLVSRLIDPSDGKIQFEGTDIGAISPRAFVHRPERRRIQHIFQDAAENLTPHLTAFAAIADPLRRLSGLADVDDRVRELADSVSLSRDLLERYPHQLSGGQKARVGIARGLASQPSLLILDEPTAALDVSVQAAILRLLHGLRRDLDLSYLLISHDIEVVRLMCERIIVLRNGQVVEAGQTAQVLQAPQSDYGRMLLAAVPRLPSSTRDATASHRA